MSTEALPNQGVVVAVRDSGGPLQAPVGQGVLSRMFDVFGNTIDHGPALSDVAWRPVHQAPPALAVPDENIDELLEQLRGTLQRERQGSIDEELFDVISGFEALSNTGR